MSGQWWESDLIVGPFANMAEANAWAAANPSSLFQGLLATIGGVPYSWRGAGVGWMAAGGGSVIIPCFDTIAARDAAYPAPSLGQKVCIKRLCGNGYFEMSYEGLRWAVRPGESIIRDAGGIGISSGYAYTAASTGLVQLSSYTIPAGLIGDGEVWGFTVAARNAGVYVSGSDTCQIRLASLPVTTLTAATAVNKGGRSEASYICRSATFICNSGTSSPFASNAIIIDTGVDMNNAQIISVNAAAGAVTNTMNISEFGVYRKL